MENVTFNHIRTVGPIIYAPSLASSASYALVDSSIIDDIDLPGVIDLTNVDFYNVNTIVPYDNVKSASILPGIMSVQYFGIVTLNNV